MNGLLHAAMLGAAATAGGSSGEAPRPVSLVATQTATGVELRVVGRSEMPLDARYSLAVADHSNNSSVQSGRVYLDGGREVTLVRLRLRPGAWSARLRVQPEAGEAYDLTQSGGA
jgi:hypothetical protein